MAAEYVFVDEWDVDAPIEAVYDVLAEARTYPEWWKPVYISVEGDGQVTRHRFKGRLPYTLEMRSEMVSEDRPNRFEVRVWTLTAREGGTHVHFDWVVFADHPLVGALTPVLRPLFRWNHNWSIERAREGLEPYARRRAGLESR